MEKVPRTPRTVAQQHNPGKGEPAFDKITGSPMGGRVDRGSFVDYGTNDQGGNSPSNTEEDPSKGVRSE